MIDTGKPLDIHVHMVGNGSGGSGCWLRARGVKKHLYRFMESGLGLPAGTMAGNLEAAYLRLLLRHLRTSSLGGVCLFAMDQVYDRAGRLMRDRGTFHIPNDFVLRIGRKHPLLLPTVSIHPARPDAIEELDRCVEGGAVMMKILPNCHHIDCSQPSLRRFWERMAHHRLPLLSHTGGETTLEQTEPRLAHPSRLRLPLECGVTVIAAHCAGNSGPFDPSWMGTLARMLRAHPNLWCDNSALVLPFRSAGIPHTFEEPFISRIVHGSDFPVPVPVWPVWLRGFIPWAEWRELGRIRNPLERDVQIKRALGYPEEVFTRGWKLLRLDGRKRVGDP